MKSVGEKVILKSATINGGVKKLIKMNQTFNLRVKQKISDNKMIIPEKMQGATKIIDVEDLRKQLIFQKKKKSRKFIDAEESRKHLVNKVVRKRATVTGGVKKPNRQSEEIQIL